MRSPSGLAITWNRRRNTRTRQSVLPEPQGPRQEDYLAEPQYFFSGDGKLAILTVSPVKDADPENFAYSKKSIDLLRSLIAQLKERHPGIDIGLTGLPVLENDETVVSQKDSGFASWLAIVGVALLYLVVYRGLRFPLTTVASLLVGTVWARLADAHHRPSEHSLVGVRGHADRHRRLRRSLGDALRAGTASGAGHRRRQPPGGAARRPEHSHRGGDDGVRLLRRHARRSASGHRARLDRGLRRASVHCSCFTVVPALLTIFDYRLAQKKRATR